MSRTYPTSALNPIESWSTSPTTCCRATIDSREAYDTARYCLMDTLGCGLEALLSGLHQAAGADRAGHVVPNGARVPGTSVQLDPVQAAFNIGA
jgi:2-methylcitrate dehydratase